MSVENGVFLVSLDFELYWGVRDKYTIDHYRKNLQGERRAVEEMLSLFAEFGIHATWAALGFLFSRDVEQLKENLPRLLPQYGNTKLSPYPYISESHDWEAAFHFAPDLIERIHRSPGQEIGTHTFSHYYCLEDGQTAAEFREDLASAVAAAKSRGITVRSMVFPRNQSNPEYLSVLSDQGILCFRGNEPGWMYRAAGDEDQSLPRRALRLADTFLNLTGENTYSLRECLSQKPFNFPSSRFLRPYSAPLAIMEGLKLRRIEKAMESAARRGRIFHLWWHPHNFGADTGRNIAFLRRILEYYKILQSQYGMLSMNMGELAQRAGDLHAA
jgi:peptidoglycan/xylan/chitin deacetylase (PgdA/CDA1 family)